MKNLCYLLLFLVFFSCQDNNEPIDETPPVPTTLINLEYPSGMGHSGDSVYGLIGYGYDASGLRDTVSAKAKVINCSDNNYMLHKPFETSSNLLSGATFYELLRKLYHIESVTPLSSHIASLYKLAFNTDSIENNCGYVYYSANIILEFRSFSVFPDEIEALLTPEFKTDRVELSPEELVAKYGTHVLTSIQIGSKFEILYKCDFIGYGTDDEAKRGFYNRMNELNGTTPGYILEGDDANNRTNEYMIYNSLGNKHKAFGLINVTDNNPDSIRLNLKSALTENTHLQLIGIYNDGTFPLYDGINDPAKKQEVKAYIDTYLKAPLVY